MPWTIIALLTGLGAPGDEAPIVPGSTPLEEPGRYASSRGYEDTLTFYRRAFRSIGGVRWRSVVNLPGIRAKHLQNLRRRGSWAGINIYEKQGKVRFFVLPRPRSGQPPSRR